MAFLAIFGQNMRFFGYGGSKILDNLLQNVAKHVLLSPAPSKQGGVVYNCLSEAKKTPFLTKKRPFLAIFSSKNGKF